VSFEFEQDGSARAKYGEQLLVNLSKDLTVTLGKGFPKSNLFVSKYQLYLCAGYLKQGKAEGKDAIWMITALPDNAALLQRDKLSWVVYSPCSFPS